MGGAVWWECTFYFKKSVSTYGGCEYCSDGTDRNFSKCVKNIMAYIEIENECLVRYWRKTFSSSALIKIV